MKNIIRKILKEERRQEYLNKIVQVMKNDFPLFNNIKLYGFYDQLSEDELNYVFSGVFGQKEPVIVKGKNIYNNDGIGIYSEYSNGKWVKRECDKNGNMIYYENSEGYWWENEYDKNGNIIKYKNSQGKIIDYR